MMTHANLQNSMKYFKTTRTTLCRIRKNKKFALKNFAKIVNPRNCSSSKLHWKLKRRSRKKKEQISCTLASNFKAKWISGACLLLRLSTFLTQSYACNNLENGTVQVAIALGAFNAVHKGNGRRWRREEGTILDVILNAHTRMKCARCNWAARGYMATRASVLTSDKSAACSWNWARVQSLV